MRHRDTRMGAALTLLTFLLAGCVETAPWYGEGREGGPCFPDDSCDPGLVCRNFTCAHPVRLDSGTVDPPDASVPSPDRALPVDSNPCNLSAPTIKPMDPTTPHDEATIYGHAPGAERVEASLGGKVFKASVVDDFFCIQVDLPSVTQPVTFKLHAIKGSCRSPASTATIQKVPVQPENVLAGLKAQATQAQGDLAPLTDGNNGTATEFSFWDTTSECDNSALIRFELPQIASIDKVVIRYPSNIKSDFLRCWKLYGAASIAVPGPSGWTELAGQSNSTGKKELQIALQGRQLRHLALRLYEDGGQGPYETFRIAEIEAWTSGAPPFVGCR